MFLVMAYAFRSLLLYVVQFVACGFSFLVGDPLRRCSWEVFNPQRTSPYPQGCLTLRRSCMGRVEYPMVPAYAVMAETASLTYLLPERSSLPAYAGVTCAGFPAQRMRFPFLDLHPHG